MKLSAKILFSIQSTAILIFIMSIGYVSIDSKYTAEREAKRLTDAYAREYANIVKSELNMDLSVSRTMAHAFLGEDLKKMDRNLYEKMLKSLFMFNPMFRTVWCNWELSFIDSTYKKKYGRVRTEIFINNGKIITKRDTLNIDGDDKSSTYYGVKIKPEEKLTNPYDYSITGSQQDAVLVTSVLTPFLVEDKFAGMVGIDVPLARFQNITDKIKPFKNSFAFLVANNGNFVAHPNKNNIGKMFMSIYPKYNTEHEVLKNIQDGNFLSFTIKNSKKEEQYIAFAPFSVGETKTPWAIGIVVPMETISEKANKSFIISLFVALFGLLILSVVIWLISRYITKPLIYMSNIVKDLAKGNINQSKKLPIKTKDEIGEINNSINLLIDGLVRTADFAKEIGKGDLNAKFQLLSKDDLLGKSLLDMRSSLKKSKKKDLKRKEEDKKNVWSADVLTKLGEILRHNDTDLTELGFELIKELVEQLNANQGGVFIVNNENSDDVFIELIASYAYNRKKFVEKRIELGVNLIGRCILEKETIYMTKLPKNYLTIESGLGDARPKSLLIVPLIFNKEVFGVLEIASFYRLKPYEIDLVQKISERVASTISNLKVNIRTKKLLLETQKQSEILLSQEEEMRQNLEELQATQEESHRNSTEMQEYLDTIDALFCTIEMNINGNILKANSIILSDLKYNLNMLKGKHIQTILDKTDFMFSEKIEHFKLGKKKVGAFNFIDSHQNEFILKGLFNPILDEEGLFYKVIFFGIKEEVYKKIFNK